MNVAGLKDKLSELAEKYYDQVVSIRRHLHRNPELSNQETETAGLIMSQLDTLKIPYRSGFAGNGIVAEIHGLKDYGFKSKTIALRADMDALPLTEENEVEYKSRNPGKMHACGHDAHVACLLGVAFILQEIRNDFSGKVKLIFQPSEEKIPGGALKMLEEGCMFPDEPDLVIAQHVYPLLDTGMIGLKSGIYMASTDEIYMRVKGKGGHAAMPNEITDTVSIASQIIVALQQVVSRFAPPAVPTVLSFGKFIANGATNIIPDLVSIEGTFRSMDEKWRAEAKTRMKMIAVSIATSMGAECEFEIKDGYPALINDPLLAASITANAAEYLGRKNVADLDIRMTSEDFSYFALKYPSVLYRLGIRNIEKGIDLPLHSSRFNIDEEALKTGVGLMSYLTLSLM